MWCRYAVSTWILVLLLWVAAAGAQPDSSSKRRAHPGFRIGAGWGGIWAHNPPVRHLARSHPLHLTADWVWEDPGTGWWRASGPTRFSLSLHGLDYGNPVLGQSLAAIVALEPSLGRAWSLRFGTGLVWHSRPFSKAGNPENLMLGGPFAAVMEAMLGRNLDRQGRFRLDLGLTHFSNGAFDLPNAGVNVFYLRSACLLRPLRALPGEPTEPFSLPVWQGDLHLSLGAVERIPGENKKYGVYQLQGRLYRKVGTRWSLGTGLDGSFNGAVDRQVQLSPDLGHSGWSLGVPLSWRLALSRRVALVGEFGVYAFRDNRAFDPVYQRYGLRFRLPGPFSAGFFFKSHKARAECLEWQVGVGW